MENKQAIRISTGSKHNGCNSNLEQVANCKYLGSILNDKLDYDEQWEKTAKTTNCHI
jgi:hypothetical protein